jgi:hypothetical protein
MAEQSIDICPEFGSMYCKQKAGKENFKFSLIDI